MASGSPPPTLGRQKQICTSIVLKSARELIPDPTLYKQKQQEVTTMFETFDKDGSGQLNVLG